ncbi:MAG TPA: hypothetical protein VHE35_37485 [Kofleriaceae bacterium]|nr:hypothetical protein [Kofleriaceae bacterium]
MSEAPGTPLKKHRHDLGQEDHGPVMAARTTRAIQALLGLALALTGVALAWAAVDAASGPSRPAATSPGESR